MMFDPTSADTQQRVLLQMSVQQSLMLTESLEQARKVHDAH